MRTFQRVALAIACLSGSMSVQAEVKVAVRPDGSKVIYNVIQSYKRAAYPELGWLAKKHDRRSEFDPIIEKYSAEYRVDPVLVRAVIQVESNFKPGCVSSAGARGLMQLMPYTAKMLGVRNIHDPEQNIRGGVKHLARLLRLFNNDLPRTLAAYNAGENAVHRHGGIPPYGETQAYVRRALSVFYGHPYGSISVRTGIAPRGTGLISTNGLLR